MDGDEKPHGGIGMRADLSRGEQGSERVPEGLSNRQRTEGSAMVSDILDARGNVAFTLQFKAVQMQNARTPTD